MSHVSFILAEDTVLHASIGPLEAAQLHLGAQLVASDGSLSEVLANAPVADPGETMGLPSARRGHPVILAAQSLLCCDHFLCAALFGQRRTLIRAGDLSWPALRFEPGQAPRRMHRITLRQGGSFVLSDFRNLELFASDPQDPPGPGQVLPQPYVQQLCDAGIPFRENQGRTRR